MKNLILKSTFALILIAMIGACERKTDSEMPGAVGVDNHKHFYPDISGSWVSDCLRARFTGYRRLVAGFNGSIFRIEDISYKEDTCISQLDSKEYRGTFAFEKRYAENTYLIKYQSYRKTSVTWEFQKLKVENGMFFVSDLFLDDLYGENIDTDIPLMWIGKPPYLRVPDLQFSNDLENGYYKPSSESNLCPHTIYTVKRRGAISHVYVLRGGYCSDRFVLACEGLVCTSRDYKIEIKFLRTYLFTDLKDPYTSVKFTLQ